MKPLFIWAGGKTKVIKHYMPFMPTQIDTYCNPNIDGGMAFGVYSSYMSSAEDFVEYLRYIRMPQGLDCKGYNAYIDSKGYAVDPDYEKKLNNMCK